jgi:hypothetical protein
MNAEKQDDADGKKQHEAPQGFLWLSLTEFPRHNGWRKIWTGSALKSSRSIILNAGLPVLSGIVQNELPDCNAVPERLAGATQCG